MIGSAHFSRRTAVGLEILQNPVAQIIIWAALAAILLAVGVYVIGRVRSQLFQREPIASELMSKFRDLHRRGELSDAEFRTIRTTLAAQLREELRDSDETG